MAKRQKCRRIMQESRQNNEIGKNMAVILDAEIAPKLTTRPQAEPQRSWRVRRNLASPLRTCLACELKVVCKLQLIVGVVPYQTFPRASKMRSAATKRMAGTWRRRYIASALD